MIGSIHEQRAQRHQLIVALAIVLLIAVSASAQSFKATIVGRVTDANAAVIPGATVTVTEKGTGRTHTARSNGEGSFTILQLPPGEYEVKVEATNFKRSVQTDLVLETDQTQTPEYHPRGRQCERECEYCCCSPDD